MIRDSVLAALGQPALSQQVALAGGASLDWFTLQVEPWRGARFDTNGDDCNKRSSLITGDDGRMSCLEVEVVRRLLAADVGLQAGWVQAWHCGANSWSRWIWKQLPEPIASRNRAIQEHRDRKPTYRGGHPDVAVLSGSDVFYVECKVNDPVDKQIDWISAGLELGVISSDQVIVLQVPLYEPYAPTFQVRDGLTAEYHHSITVPPTATSVALAFRPVGSGTGTVWPHEWVGPATVLEYGMTLFGQVSVRAGGRKLYADHGAALRAPWSPAEASVLPDWLPPWKESRTWWQEMPAWDLRNDK